MNFAMGLKRALLLTGGLLLAGAFYYAWSADPETREAAELRRLAGAPARIVWARQVQRGSRDVFIRGDNFQLMGLDTEDRLGKRILLHEHGNYHKPLITPRGDRVVFSDIPDRSIYVVNWDGTGLQELAPGKAVEVWMDPQTQIEWVYRLPVSAAGGDSASQPLTRFQLDNPLVQETVLEQPPLSSDSLQISQDGRKMSALFPWPTAGVIDLTTGEATELGKGCWVSLAPDNSYVMWIFDGPHRNLLMHTADGERAWTVNINSAPAIDGHEVYHPRWSNRVRFMCMTGPYKVGGGQIRIRSGGDYVNIYAGRFNETLTEIEQWVQLTGSRAADFYPDLWIQPAVGPFQTADIPSAEAVVPQEVPAVRIRARLVERTPIPSMEDIAPYTRALVVYRYRVEAVESGSLEGDGVLVAHWGLRDGRETAPRTRIGETVPLEILPYSSVRGLEGERLVMEVSDMRLPLYVEVQGN